MPHEQQLPESKQAAASRIESAASAIVTVADVEIRRSGIHGLGVFAVVDFSAHRRLTQLDGQAVPVSSHSDVLWRLEWNALTTELLLVRAIRTTYGYINHARAANLIIADDGSLETLRPIAAGEELTLDYLAQPLPPAYLSDPRAAYLYSEG